MMHRAGGDEAWFAPKRFGYGTGLPIRREGWVTLAAYLAAVTGGALFLHRRPAASIAVIAMATASFVAICARHTRGGWRWRWGSGD